jgi:hypothetical protein
MNFIIYYNFISFLFPTVSSCFFLFPPLSTWKEDKGCQELKKEVKTKQEEKKKNRRLSSTE